jgi:hypothetical protein
VVGRRGVLPAIGRRAGGAGGDDVAADPRLVLAHVREQRAAGDVADGVQPLALDVGHQQAVVGLDIAAGFQVDGLQPDAGAVRCPSRCDEDLVGDHLAAVEDDRHLAAAQLTLLGRRDVAAAYPLDLRVQPDVGTVRPQPLGQQVAGEGLVAAQQPLAGVDDRHVGSEPGEPGCRLTTHDTTPDDDDPLGDGVQVGDVTRGTRVRLAQALDRGHRCAGAGGQDDGMAGGQRAGRAVR